MKYILVLPAIALGVAAVIYGESDDSPGLQLLGALLAVGAAAYGIRTALRAR